MWVRSCIIAPPFVDGWIKQKHDFGRHCSKNCKPQQVGVVKNRAMETKKPTAFGNRHRKIIQLSKHLALQIGAAQIIGVGIIDIGIEVGNLICDERRENINDRLCCIIVLHGGQHQSLIQLRKELRSGTRLRYQNYRPGC